MPLYMDQHILPGVTAKGVAQAHLQDIMIQHDHSCNCITYWIDEKRGSVFCLVEAPTKEAVEIMHSKSHGLVPNKVIEVNSTLVESFLGRIADPEDAVMEEGLKVFSDPSFRVVLVAKINDPVLLNHELGKERATALIRHYNDIIKEKIKEYDGNEIESEGYDFIASFISAGKAIACAFAIHTMLADKNIQIGCKIAINAGEPVAKNEKLFGDTVQLAERMCAVAKGSQVIISSAVKEFISKELLHGNKENNVLMLAPADEELLSLLFEKMEENCSDADFNVEDYCASIAMSKSQLYRKTIALSGFSPNIFVKEFRLEKALTLMKQQRHNISEITFNTGFTSPSYFTKCFKKKFGITPMTYLELID